MLIIPAAPSASCGWLGALGLSVSAPDLGRGRAAPAAQTPPGISRSPQRALLSFGSWGSPTGMGLGLN